MSTPTHREEDRDPRSRSRVWQALTDAKEFGTWFKAELDSTSRGGTRDGEDHLSRLQHLELELIVDHMEPERFFAFPGIPTRATPRRPARELRRWSSSARGVAGARAHRRRIGFDRLPAERRAKAFRSNSEGWAEQMENIRRHVGG